MNNLQITADGKNHLLGCSKGILDIDGATFIATQETDHILAYTIANINIVPKRKYIGVVWQKLRFETTELRAVSDYYNHATKRPLFPEDRTMEGVEMISDRNTFQEVAPGVEVVSYDVFYDLPAAKSGDNLCAIALAKLCALHLKIGEVIRITPSGLEFQQPVNFSVAFTTRETEEDPYRLTVTPVNGVAPFEFSVDGEEYDIEPELTYLNPENKKVYVRDSAGTVASLAIEPANWNAVVLPQAV